MAAHVHRRGADLIFYIRTVVTLIVPGRPMNAYDVLRLPSYKIHAEHAANHAAIQRELNNRRRPCTCPGRAAALAGKYASFLPNYNIVFFMNTAWSGK